MSCNRYQSCQQPVVLLGMLVSQPEIAEAVRGFLRSMNLPAVNTNQGVVSLDLILQFVRSHSGGWR